MSRRFPVGRTASLACFMMLMIAARAIAASPGTLTSSSGPTPQCPFNPDGFFYAKEALPKGFEDFDHLTLWNKQEKSDHPRPGVYTTRGVVYELADDDYFPFNFTTAAVDGVSYSFAGKYDITCIFEENFRKQPEEIAAEGKLSRFENGKQVAETAVKFIYSPKSRGLMDDVNAPYPSGKTELTYAVLEGDTKKVRALLTRGAKVDARDVGGWTPLRHLVSHLYDSAKAVEIARLLIAAGADVNLKDEYGETILMFAVYRNSELFKHLLAAGADVNAKTNYGITPLMRAVGATTNEWRARSMGNDVADSAFENVKALLRAGARVNERDNSGATALSMVTGELNTLYLSKDAESKYRELISLLKRAGAVE